MTIKSIKFSPEDAPLFTMYDMMHKINELVDKVNKLERQLKDGEINTGRVRSSAGCVER